MKASLAAAAIAASLAAISGIATVLADAAVDTPKTFVAETTGLSTTRQSSPLKLATKSFSPPAEASMPEDEFGKMVHLGERIFERPAQTAPDYVGNPLRCSSCHLDAGRKPGAAPMWAAYVAYPAFRAKNGHVNTFEERLQGCFRFSMNGRAPPAGDKTLVALESYAHWLAQGAPVDGDLPGRGFPKLDQPALPADYARGEKVYAAQCLLCHGRDGAGLLAADGSMAFPALWGATSFNWGAGMGSIDKAAAFIKANMPLSLGNTLTDQDAWDVATYMNSHERPQDPRFLGTVEATRAKFHDPVNSMYGKTIDGRVLGAASEPAGGTTRRRVPVPSKAR